MSKARSRMVALARRVGEVYHQIFHIYRRWWMYILPFAAILLIPLEILETLLEHEISGLQDGRVGEYLFLSTLAGALASTGLIGQVFMAGAIGLSLNHTRDGKPPRLGWLARHISYRRLFAVDLLYLVAIFAGGVLLVIPGLIAFTLLALAGPVVEIEDRGVRGAFARSFRLVRQDVWLVFWVLFSIQFGGFYIGEAIQHLTSLLLGERPVAEAIASGAPEVLLEPLFAIAAVLLTIRLAGLKPPPVASPHHEAD